LLPVGCFNDGATKTRHLFVKTFFALLRSCRVVREPQRYRTTSSKFRDDSFLPTSLLATWKPQSNLTTMVLFGGLLPIPSQLLLDVATLVGLAAGTWTLKLNPLRNTKTTDKRK